jgi:uncharacterized glyoxalase superfamily protein PhnB
LDGLLTVECVFLQYSNRFSFTLRQEGRQKASELSPDAIVGGIAMIANRSVPPDTVLPHVVYRSVEDALAWLSKAFGFREHYHYGGGPISGAQIHLGNAWIMIRRAREGEKTPAQVGCCTQSLTIFVEDVEAHYQTAKSAGAKIVEELHETEYGELQYGALDLDGHHWLFSRHARDVSPDQWGATVVEAYTPR